VESLPVAHPALQGSLVGKPVHIWLLLLQMLQQRDRHQRRLALQQRHKQALPDLLQRVRSGPTTGLSCFGLQAGLIQSLSPDGLVAVAALLLAAP
jgi:hypothetical protein